MCSHERGACGATSNRPYRGTSGSVNWTFSETRNPGAPGRCRWRERGTTTAIPFFFRPDDDGRVFGAPTGVTKSAVSKVMAANPKQKEGGTMKRMMTLLAIAGLILALAPGAWAQTINVLYTEGFVATSPTDPYDPEIALQGTDTGWESVSGWTTPPESYGGGNGFYLENNASTPDGDSSYTLNGAGNSGSKAAIAQAGEFTISEAQRSQGEIVFTADWAVNNTLGMRFIAEVGGKWYGSEIFGTDDGSNGTIASAAVTEWVEGTSVNVNSGTWYALLDGKSLTSRWSDPAWDTEPLSGVPDGEIARFGMNYNHAGNGDIGALDHFVVTVVIPPPAGAVLIIE